MNTRQIFSSFRTVSHIKFLTLKFHANQKLLSIPLLLPYSYVNCFVISYLCDLMSIEPLLFSNLPDISSSPSLYCTPFQLDPHYKSFWPHFTSFLNPLIPISFDHPCSANLSSWINFIMFSFLLFSLGLFCCSFSDS